MNQKRKSIKEINTEMDMINKRKPSKSQIEELSKVIKDIDEKNGAHNLEEMPRRKISIPRNHLMTSDFDLIYASAVSANNNT